MTAAERAYHREYQRWHCKHNPEFLERKRKRQRIWAQAKRDRMKGGKGDAMSNYTRSAYHPTEHVIRAALWLDDHFGKHQYGVMFSGDKKVYRPNDVEIPIGMVFVEQKTMQPFPSTDVTSPGVA